MDIKALIARQLSDHQDTPSGVAQATYHTWTSDHIGEAVVLASQYLYSLFPDKFSTVVSLTTEVDSCMVPLGACAKILDVLSVGGLCDNVVEQNDDQNSLLGMLSPQCSSGKEETSNYEFKVRGDNIQFSDVIPKGTTMELLCASPPKEESDLTSGVFAQFQPLIVNYALWFLLHTDNESTSNLARAQGYYQMLKDYVTQVLLIEFSLREDDYQNGRRKVDDR